MQTAQADPATATGRTLTERKGHEGVLLVGPAVVSQEARRVEALGLAPEVGVPVGAPQVGQHPAAGTDSEAAHRGLFCEKTARVPLGPIAHPASLHALSSSREWSI